MEIVYVLTSP